MEFCSFFCYAIFASSYDRPSYAGTHQTGVKRVQPERSIIIVDDEPWALVSLEKIFNRPDLGFHVSGAFQNENDALAYAIANQPDFAFLDIRLSYMDGIELAEHIRAGSESTHIVIISAYADFDYAQRAIQQSVLDYLVKPVTRAKAENLLLKLSRIEPGEKKPSPLPDESGDLFSRLLSYVNLHYSEPLQLSTLAQHFYINESYCSSLFHARLGMTYSAYIRQLRLEKAASLLLETTLPIKEISSRVGYSDFLYFSKSFHRQYEMAPTEYREYQASLKEADDHA